MTPSEFLTYFERVRPVGGAWVACCPAHDDRTPSLSIDVDDEGRIGLKCFAGCSQIEILRSVGLDWPALFPKDLPRQTQQQAREARKRVREADWLAALGVLDTEATIVYFTACDVINGKELTERKVQSLGKAINRIHAARVKLDERR